MRKGKFKQGKVPRQGKFSAGVLTVRVKEALVCSDFHVPAESKKWLNKLLAYRREHKISQIIIAGDFWNHDAVSRWELKDPFLNLRKELQRGKEVLDLLTAEAHVYLTCGNHDERMPRALNHALSFVDWMRMIHTFNLTVTDNDFLYLVSGQRNFRVCHPHAYSRIKGKQASSIAHDLQEDVMMGHQHYLSLLTNNTGKYVSIDLGCMCDSGAFLYKRKSTTRHPDWENGFVHLKGGQVKMITDYTFE